MATSTTRLELVRPVQAELVRQEFERIKRWHRDSCIENFAENLEVSRLMFRRYPELVKADVFPEPYRTSMIHSVESGYDPELESNISLNDAHILDPAGADAEDEEFAREVMEKRAADARNKAADALARMRTSAVQ